MSIENERRDVLQESMWHAILQQVPVDTLCSAAFSAQMNALSRMPAGLERDAIATRFALAAYEGMKLFGGCRVEEQRFLKEVLDVLNGNDTVTAILEREGTDKAKALLEVLEPEEEIWPEEVS